MIPVTRNATVGPVGAGGAPGALTAATCDAANRGTRINVPTCTPWSWRSVEDASTWPRAEGAGMEPATSCITGGSAGEGPTRRLKLVVAASRERVQLSQAGGPLKGAVNTVKDATSGSV